MDVARVTAVAIGIYMLAFLARLLWLEVRDRRALRRDRWIRVRCPGCGRSRQEKPARGEEVRRLCWQCRIDLLGEPGNVGPPKPPAQHANGSPRFSWKDEPGPPPGNRH